MTDDVEMVYLLLMHNHWDLSMDLKGILHFWKDECEFKMGHLLQKKCEIIFEFGAF